MGQDLKDEVKRQMDIFKQGAAEIIPEEELEQKLTDALRQGRPLKVKLGLDPSAPDIHLGHTVVLQKLKQFQDCGHQVILIIGDFTGRIGDPTGKSETRRQLSEPEIRANAETYEKQIFKVLDPKKTRVVMNSSWLGKLSFQDVIELAAKVTVARMLERDDFAKRFYANLPIGVHEFFYPLMQGYDSIALQADVELGGTDQKFNLLMGRSLQKDYGQEPQVVLMMPIIEGLDGVQKMSKSLNNYVGINEAPEEMYGKIMSIPDGLIARYFELLTQTAPEEIDVIKKSLAAGEVNPRDLKMRLAAEIVRTYHGNEAAAKAEEHFKTIFQQKALPTEIPEKELHSFEPLPLASLLKAMGLAASTSEARRAAEQGGVKVDGEKILDANTEINPKPGMILQVGKRKFIKIKRP